MNNKIEQKEHSSVKQYTTLEQVECSSIHAACETLTNVAILLKPAMECGNKSSRHV